MSGTSRMRFSFGTFWTSAGICSYQRSCCENCMYRLWDANASGFVLIRREAKRDGYMPSTHEIKPQNGVIRVGFPEGDTVVGTAGASDDDGFLHGCPFVVVQLKFQFQKVADL
jgi:hypothetical protein